MERFKNRPDKLTYRSVVYDPETPETSDLKLMERNYGREVKIKKNYDDFYAPNFERIFYKCFKQF